MIVVNIKKDGISLFEEIIQQYPDSIDVDEVEYAFDGQTIYQVFLEITKATLPIVASILVSKEGKGKIIEIKKNGIEIKAPIKEGLTLEQVMELLKGLLNEDVEDAK